MDDYVRNLSELCTDVIARNVIRNYYGKPIEKIYDLIQQEYIKATSHYWFPGKLVLLYPCIREMKSKNHYETIYGAHIAKGMNYVDYHGLLVLPIPNGDKYVLGKSLRFEVGDSLPMTIMDLEELERTTEVNIPIRKLRKG